MNPNSSYHRIGLSLILLAVGALSACTSEFVIPDSISSQWPSQETDQPHDRTEADYLQQAVQALDQAAAVDGLERITHLEQACWAAARAQQADLINQALTLYPQATLSAEQSATRASYQALLAAMQEKPSDALRLLSEATRPNNARSLADNWLAHALAYRLLDDGAAATLMLVRRDSQIAPPLRDANNQRIWDLQLEASRFLFQDDQTRYDATTQGWLELGRIARQFWNSEQAIQEALQQWQLDFPGHPAAVDFWPEAQELALQTLNSAVRRVALLLPLSGRLKSAAAAVRDGFIAAHLGDPASGLDIRLYDASSNPIAAYDQAVADGAQLIIGPLGKQQVERVVQHNAGRLPVLALNYRDQTQNTPAVLEFGLSPEDEARSAALRALDDGLTHAIALVSDDDFGRRSLDAFRAAFQADGGTLLDASFFSGSPRDYQNTIKSLLKLKQSAARFKAIERLVGEDLDAAPVRRQDAQLVFLAAKPQAGRQIRPQLKYYHAEDLPIYSGGRIYGGSPDPRRDKDLNGVNFCAMPWLLGTSQLWRNRRDAVEQAWPQRARRLERLYAMGNDAYLLASSLRNTSWQNLPVIAGATGQLHRQQSRIVRTLPCTRFVGGVPDTRTEVKVPAGS